MANVDWTEEERAPNLTPGIYRAKVAECEEKRSRSGDLYFNVRLDATDFGCFLCYDILMLQGKGRGIGQGKLEALGFEKKPEILAAELIGREVFVAVVEDEYQGKKKLKADISAEGAIFGYWPMDETPPVVRTPDPAYSPTTPAEVDETPF